LKERRKVCFFDFIQRKKDTKQQKKEKESKAPTVAPPSHDEGVVEERVVAACPERS
jgi:hypothetical protein